MRGVSLLASAVLVALTIAPPSRVSAAEPEHESEAELENSDAPDPEPTPVGLGEADEPPSGDGSDVESKPPATPAPRPSPQFGAGPQEAPSTTAAPHERDSLDASSVPGGYWGPTDTREPQPSDGRRKILIGSIVAPLGLLAGTTGAVFTYLSAPEHCVQRYASIGVEVQRSRCGGLQTLNAIRTGYGALMVVTGVVFLAMGLAERKERREWDSRHSSARRRARRVTLAPSAGGWALKF